MKEPASMTRRGLLVAGAAAAVGTDCEVVTSGERPVAGGTYERLGVRTFINAVGTVTTFSGTLIRPEVKDAMELASRSFVRIHDLQEKAGKRLAELTGAEAAFVTAGASCSLCLATCAVTAGDDPEKMRPLPDLSGMRDEVIIQSIHRTSYDHAFRMVGVRLVEVETAEQMRAAIGDRTAACAYVQSHHTLGGKIGLEEYTQISHDAGLPVILDAAAELPRPRTCGSSWAWESMPSPLAGARSAGPPGGAILPLRGSQPRFPRIHIPDSSVIPSRAILLPDLPSR